MDADTETPMPRRALLIALSAAIALAVAATGFGAVTIYSNDFKSRHEFKSVRKAAGGKACDRNWHKRKAFGITIDEKKADCAYEPPVYSDGSGGNQSVKMIFKLFAENTTSKIRRGAFGFLAVRASDSSRYQLRVFPKAGRWELRRSPASSAFPVKGKLEAIAPFGKRNTIQMGVKKATIDAWVQGKRVVKGKVDPSAAQVGGNAVRVGIGQGRKAKRPTAGIVSMIRIDLPNP